MPSETPRSTATFAELGLRDEIIRALTDLGYEEPTPIQAATIAPLLEGRDLLGQAATGTGKTAAFALPIIEHLGDRAGGNKPKALILAPTRELAMQVSEAIHKYGRVMGSRVQPVFGGQPIFRQIQALRRGVDIVVATPGRAIDLIARRALDLSEVETLVIDEADEMLDMGFAEDIEALLDAAPDRHQTVLFSATMPPRIAHIARTHLNDPVRIEIERAPVAEGETPAITQSAYLVPRSHKPAALGRILDVVNPDATLVFCRTRHEVDDLTETLNGRGYRAEALHGGMDQQQRDRVMGRLRGGVADLLVATDVAARGLDVEHLTHVVNFDVPSSPESYVHRIGRVGRAGRAGAAITLLEPRQHRLLKNIERMTGQRIPIEQVPSVDDLRSRRNELLQQTLAERIEADDLDRHRPVIEALAEEHDIVEIALAAIALYRDSSREGADEIAIPEVSLRPDRNTRGKDRDRGRSWDRDDRRSGDRDDRRGRGERRDRPNDPNMTKLYIGAGREARINPGDLVGAICNETNLSGRDIGVIDIFGRFSLVEVPKDRSGDVIDALRGTTIRGRKVDVRPDRNA